MTKRMERWITCLIDGLDKHVDEETKAMILEQCGRQCQSQGFIEKARRIYEQSQNMEEFLNAFSEVYENLHIEGNSIYIVYPKCYCSFVNKIPSGTLSATYCNCSRGWAKELFEKVLGRTVEVIMEESIMNGDQQCRFQIIL